MFVELNFQGLTSKERPTKINNSWFRRRARDRGNSLSYGQAATKSTASEPTQAPLPPPPACLGCDTCLRAPRRRLCHLGPRRAGQRPLLANPVFIPSTGSPRPLAQMHGAALSRSPFPPDATSAGQPECPQGTGLCAGTRRLLRTGINAESTLSAELTPQRESTFVCGQTHSTRRG